MANFHQNFIVLTQTYALGVGRSLGLDLRNKGHPNKYTSASARLRRADNEESSYKKRSILNIERVYVAPILIFGLFYVNTLKEENIFKLIRNIPPFSDF